MRPQISLANNGTGEVTSQIVISFLASGFRLYDFGLRILDFGLKVKII
jgi:hypothetical protein